MFTKPITSEDLLNNIKIAVKREAFLDSKFSSDKNFTSVFGKVIVIRVEDTLTKKYIEIRNSPKLQESSCLDPDPSVYSWGVNSNSDRSQRSVRIVAGLRYADPHCMLSVDVVERLFGTPTRVTPIFGNSPPPHGRNVIFGPTTHRLGNSDIKYEIQEAGSVATLQFEILGDGTVRNFGLSQGDK